MNWDDQEYEWTLLSAMGGGVRMSADLQEYAQPSERKTELLETYPRVHIVKVRFY